MRGDVLPLGCWGEQPWGYEITNLPVKMVREDKVIHYFFGGGTWIAMNADSPPPKEWVNIGLGDGQPPFSLSEKNKSKIL